jgi:hypothetical protein
LLDIIAQFVEALFRKRFVDPNHCDAHSAAGDESAPGSIQKLPANGYFKYCAALAAGGEDISNMGFPLCLLLGKKGRRGGKARD